MGRKESYEESVTLVLERIAHQMPYDLVEKFSEFSKLTRATFILSGQKPPGS